MKSSLSRSLPVIFAVITIVLAIMTMYGWISGNEFLKRIRPSYPPMKFNTAVFFLLSGVSLFLRTVAKSAAANRISYVLALIVLVAAVLTIIQYPLKISFGIDELFRTEPENQNFPGRMSGVTALLFIFLSIALLCIDRKKYHGIVQVTIPIVLLGSVIIAFSYVSGINYLQSFPFAITTALHTSVSFILLSLGLFYSPALSRIKYSFEKRIAMFLSVAIMLLIISFFSVNQNNVQFIRNNELVDHTRNVLYQSMKVLVEAQNIETGTRGFLLTGDQTFLFPFERARREIDKTADSLTHLTIDNKLQAQKMKMITALIDSNLAIHQRVILLKEQGDESAVSRFLASGTEKRLMESLRVSIFRLQDAENVLLVQRKTSAQRSINNSVRQITILQFILAAMLIIVFVAIYNYAKTRNKAESELRQSEMLIRRIIDNANNPIAIKDHEGRYLLVNRQSQKNIGVPEEEIIGRTAYDFFPASVVDQVQKEERAIFESGQMTETSTEIMLEDGLHYFISVRFPLYDDKDKIYAVCSISTDVTSVKRAEAQLSRAYEQQGIVLDALQRVMTSAMDVICIIDKNGQFVQVSEGSYELWGYTPDELKGKKYLDFVYEEDKADSIETAGKVITGDTVHNFENRYVRKDGRLIPVIWSATWSLKDETLYAIARDGTQRRLDAQQLADLNVTLAKRAIELQASNTELERFAYVASHDLQEPLRMVSSFLQLLEKKLEGQLDDTTKKYIFFAVDGAERMKKLIQDLLQYSRVGSNKETVGNVDCNEVMEVITRMYSLAIEESKAVLTVHPLPVIKGEKSLIQQLFLNLVGNALKYADKQPIIEIGYEENDREWQFFVKDNGIGIDSKFFQKIFVIFQRLHNKTEYSGTGIGLAICKKIVDRHGGKIWVESEPKNGSTFFFTIPKMA